MTYHQLGWLEILDGRDYAETRSFVNLRSDADVTTNVTLSPHHTQHLVPPKIPAW